MFQGCRQAITLPMSRFGGVTLGGTPLHFCEKLMKTVAHVYQQDVLQGTITPLNTSMNGDANLCFNTRLVFTHLITQYMERFFTGRLGQMFKKRDFTLN
jgi:hypothetical protein